MCLIQYPANQIYSYDPNNETRPDTWLPKSRAGGRGCMGGQGLYLRSLDHLGRSGEVKKVKQIKKVKWGPTDRLTNQLTDRQT